jgi:hypothetical protein
VICRLAGGARLAVVALLLITAQPGRFVLCLAADHAELEDAFALCCGDAKAVASGPRQASLLSASSFLTGCGDCTDVPLVSACPPEPEQKVADLEAAPGATLAHAERWPIFSPSPTFDRAACGSVSLFESRLTALRC